MLLVVCQPTAGSSVFRLRSLSTAAAVHVHMLLHVLQASSSGVMPVDGKSPPLLSRRAESLTGGGWDLNVSDMGDMTLSVGESGSQIRLNVVSAFSEAGPRWNTLGDVSGMPTMGDGNSGPTELSSGIKTRSFDVQVDRSAELDGRWVVHAEIQQDAGTRPSFLLIRVVQLEPAPPALPLKILINDSLTSLAPVTIGLHVRHHAKLLGGSVSDVVVPGRYEPGVCGTENNQGIFGTPYHPVSVTHQRTHFLLPLNGGSLVVLAF